MGLLYLLLLSGKNKNAISCLLNDILIRNPPAYELGVVTTDLQFIPHGYATTRNNGIAVTASSIPKEPASKRYWAIVVFLSLSKRLAWQHPQTGLLTLPNPRAPVQHLAFFTVVVSQFRRNMLPLYSWPIDTASYHSSTTHPIAFYVILYPHLKHRGLTLRTSV
jgi:hypothetical protein